MEMNRLGSFLDSGYAIFCYCLFALGLCLVISYYTAKCNFEAGYKAACIDFYKGSIKMELKAQPNGELLWVKKGELK